MFGEQGFVSSAYSNNKSMIGEFWEINRTFTMWNNIIFVNYVNHKLTVYHYLNNIYQFNQMLSGKVMTTTMSSLKTMNTEKTIESRKVFDALIFYLKV